MGLIVRCTVDFPHKVRIREHLRSKPSFLVSTVGHTVIAELVSSLIVVLAGPNTAPISSSISWAPFRKVSFFVACITSGVCLPAPSRVTKLISRPSATVLSSCCSRVGRRSSHATTRSASGRTRISRGPRVISSVGVLSKFLFHFIFVFTFEESKTKSSSEYGDPTGVKVWLA